jgi:hypothetical protein
LTATFNAAAFICCSTCLDSVSGDVRHMSVGMRRLCPLDRGLLAAGTIVGTDARGVGERPRDSEGR